MVTKLDSGWASATIIPWLTPGITSMRGGKARPKASFWFDVQEQPVADSSHGPLAQKPHLQTIFENCQDNRVSSGYASGSSTHSRTKGSHGSGVHLLQSTTSSSSSPSVMQVGKLPQFLDQWRTITSISFVFNVNKGHNLQLSCHPLIFVYFQIV